MRLKIFALLLTITLVLAACSTIEPPKQEDPINKPPISTDPVTGGNLTIGTNIQALMLDPLGYRTSPSPLYSLDLVLYRGLLSYDEELKLTNGLAEGFVIDQENNSVTFKLKKNIKWQDGSAITLNDIRFTLEWYSQGDYQGKWKDYTFDIIGTDDYRRGKNENVSGISISTENDTITVTFKKLDPLNLQLFTAPILTEDKLQGKKVKEVLAIANAGELQANGPFKLQTRDINEWILTRNDFYEEIVYLDGIVFTNYSADKVDVLLALPQHVEKRAEDKELITIAGQGYTYLGMNLNNKIWEDLNNRKALAQAIDQQKIIKDIYLGYGSKPLTPIHPTSWAYKAVEISSEVNTAAFANKEVTLELAYEATKLNEALAKDIAQQISRIGVTIDLTPITPVEYIPSLFSKGNYDLFLANWPYELDPAEENYKWLTKNDVLLGGYNVSHINDTTSDDMLIKASNIIDVNQRKDSYDNWQEYFMGQYYYIPIVSPQTIFLVDKRAHIELSNSLIPYNNINNWWIENTPSK